MWLTWDACGMVCMYHKGVTRRHGVLISVLTGAGALKAVSVSPVVLPFYPYSSHTQQAVVCD